MKTDVTLSISAYFSNSLSWAKHKNVPELLKKVLTQISGNVENMLSKSRGDYAYTIIDVAGAGADDLAKIAAVDGVIRVRAI